MMTSAVRRFLGPALFAATLMAVGGGWAAERTVELRVEKMTCAACPYIVKRTLARVPGVNSVAVSYRQKSAVVSFDDDETNLAALKDATLKAGYPSEVVER